MSDRLSYEHVVQSQLEAWNAEIDQILPRVEHANPEVKADLNGQLEEIHALKQRATEHLAKMNEVDAEAWKVLKDELEHLWQGIEEAFHPLRQL